MATAFEELYNHIRILVGDTDEIVKRYTSEILDSQIILATTILGDDDIEIDESDETSFTSDLELVSKAKVIFKVAEALVSCRSESFSWKSPVMQVSKRGQYKELLRFIRETLNSLLGNECPIDFDTEYEYLLNASAKHWSMISDAQGVEL